MIVNNLGMRKKTSVVCCRENMRMMCGAVLAQCTCVTDRQTDRQTNRQTAHNISTYAVLAYNASRAKSYAYNNVVIW